MMAEYTELNLYDPESDEQYNIQISHEDAIKAQNDMAFASALLNHARENISSVVTMDTSYSPVNIEEEDNSASHTEEELGDGFRWFHEAILLLIEEYRRREQDMNSGKITQRKAWEQIAQTLNSKGYKVTGRQCATRVNTMKRTYKSVKDHNKKSGNNKRSWKYLELMDNLLGKKPSMTPLSTISSTGLITSKSDEASTSSTFSETSCNEGSDVNIKVSRKRKTSDIAQAIVESREIAEKEKENRHRERMEMKEKLMAKLDDILKKL